MILSSMAISRLLSPEEIGIYSVSVGLIAIMTAFRDFGAGNYLVTSSAIDEKIISSVWTVMILFGAFFTAIVFGVGYFSEYFYDSSEIQEVIYISALSFIITPFSAIKYAILMRDMQYKIISGIRFSGNLMAALFSIALAYYDFGAASLAYGNLASIIIVTSIFSFYCKRVNYLKFSFFDLRKIFKFGGIYTFANTYKTFVNIMPEILIGKFYSFHDAGIFSRGMGLSQMFHRLIVDASSPVILSRLSNAERQEENIGALFIYYNSIISAFGWSLLVFIAYNADILINLLYGDQWGDAVIYCQLACLWVGLSIISMNVDTMFLAKQQMKTYLAINFFSSTSKLIAVSIGVFFGPTEIIISMCTLSFLSAPFILYKASIVMSFDFYDIARKYASSLLIALSVLVVNHVCFLLIPINNIMIEIIVHSAFSFVAFIVCACVTHTIIRFEITKIFNSIKNKFF